MTNDIRIETERMILRVPATDDAHEMNAALNEVWHELQLWMSWSYDGQNSPDATRYYIEHMVPEQIQAGGLPLNGYCRKSGKFVIATGITMRDSVPIIGYWVTKDFLGKGYATEASRAVLDHAFADMNLRSVITEHYDGNDKSRRVIEKLGFTKTGVTEKSHARCLDGVWLDEHHYEITQDQWRQRWQ